MKSTTINVIISFFVILFAATFCSTIIKRTKGDISHVGLTDTLNQIKQGEKYIYRDLYTQVLDEYYDTIRVGKWKVIEDSKTGVYSIGMYHPKVFIKDYNNFWELQVEDRTNFFSQMNERKVYPKVGQWKYYTKDDKLMYSKYYYNDECLFVDDIQNDFWEDRNNQALCYVKKQKNLKLYQYDWYIVTIKAEESDLTKENLYAQVLLDSVNDEVVFYVKKIYIFQKGNKIDSLVFDK